MSPPHRRLPPLPHSSLWSKHFPSRYLPLSPDSNVIRKAQGRILVATPSLADRIVRSIPIREGEVIIEGFAGVGGLTRSLLNGGREQEESSKWRKDVLPELLNQKTAKPLKGKAKKKQFPTWLDDLKIPARVEFDDQPSLLKQEAEAAIETLAAGADLVGTANDPSPEEDLMSTESGSKAETSLEPQRRPRIVIASEGSLDLLQRGFDYPDSAAYPKIGLNARRSKNKTVVVPSPHETNLLLSHSSTYVWPVIPDLLTDELVQPHLPIYDPTLQGEKIHKRPWSAEPPPITLVCQVPDSSIGEQLAAQWIGSVVGDLDQERTWIWEWGRIRMALLCGRSLYDRIMAKPGELIHCKLSILARALFDLTPIPPLHHVRNIDKTSKLTSDRPLKHASKVPKSTLPPVRMPLEYSSQPVNSDLLSTFREKEKTITYNDDFYPASNNAIHRTKPVKLGNSSRGSTLTRPSLLGLLLEPKKESPVLANQKDAWDYVMRRLFVRDTLELGEAVSNISFGAEALVPRFESTTEEFRGIPVDRRRVVRELEVEEWARIVDVFDQWAFKPDNLILDSGQNDEFHRELGHD